MRYLKRSEFSLVANKKTVTISICLFTFLSLSTYCFGVAIDLRRTSWKYYNPQPEEDFYKYKLGFTTLGGGEGLDAFRFPYTYGEVDWGENRPIGMGEFQGHVDDNNTLQVGFKNTDSLENKGIKPWIRGYYYETTNGIDKTVVLNEPQEGNTRYKYTLDLPKRTSVNNDHAPPDNMTYVAWAISPPDGGFKEDFSFKIYNAHEQRDTQEGIVIGGVITSKSIEINVVPEPNTAILLFLMGGLVMVLNRLRQTRL